MKTLENTLYVQTQGTYIHLDHDTVRLELEGATMKRIPLHHVGEIVVFGNVLVSPFLIGRCAEDGRGLVWLTRHGRFMGRLAGRTTGNVLLRRAQHRVVDSRASSAVVAKRVLVGKLQNARNVLLRAARESGDEGDRAALLTAAREHAGSIRALAPCEDLDEMRGLEGIAARAYFGAFSSMVRANRPTFRMYVRSKHPAQDPVNALLSFVYGLLRNDCAAACEGVGLDPQMGFLHTLRPGRASLALDLMEELRPCLADRLVLTLVNRQQIGPGDFLERPGGAVNLTEEGRKTVVTAYQRRKAEEVPHPFTGSSVPFGLVPHLQARLLARHLRGDTPSYPPFIMR